MTVQLMHRTADPFGIGGTFPPKLIRVAPSTVDPHLVSEEIRRVLEEWADLGDTLSRHGDVAVSGSFSASTLISFADGDPLRDIELFTGADVRGAGAIGSSALPYPMSPVEAVEFVRDILQVSQDSVLSAVGVKARTFFGWRTRTDSRPRSSSLGVLWAMADALYYLQNSHPNLASWYHANPAAQEAFAAGRVNRLVQLEHEWAAANRRPVYAPRAPYFGDPGDPDAASLSDATGTGADEMVPLAPRARSRRRARVTLPSSAVTAAEPYSDSASDGSGDGAGERDDPGRLGE
jgi:hypothetical protein